MFLARISRMLTVAAVGFVFGGLLTATAQAQHAGPPAPRLFRPQTRAISSQYSPRFMRPAGMTMQENISGVPVDDGTGGGLVYGDPMIVGDMGGEMIVGENYLDHAPLPDCDSCGMNDCYDCGPPVDPRDCGGLTDDCWMGGLGALYCNSEFFTGAHGFKSQIFGDPTVGREPESDSFGFHYGVNAGLPLYRITCGLVSGQIGVNSVQSNFSEGLALTGDRQQTFITGGFFRRVDYGLQFGVVTDILHEEWDTTIDLVQVRAELGWVWPAGHTLGFRMAEGVQDDDGFIGSVFLPSVNAQTIDYYRLFYRHACSCGGYGEFFVGRSDEQHTVFGVDYDLPIASRVALQTGFTYLAPDDELLFVDNETWNIFVGLSFRPRGREWFQFYHRPLFDAADNGTMIISRR